MSVTIETFHVDTSPLNIVAPRNMPDMLLTRDKSGTSVAIYPMFDAP